MVLCWNFRPLGRDQETQILKFAKPLREGAKVRGEDVKVQCEGKTENTSGPSHGNLCHTGAEMP